MSRYTCPDCLKSVDDKGSPHDCGGSREDLIARVAALEEELRGYRESKPPEPAIAPIPTIIDVSADGGRLRIFQDYNVVDLDLEWFVRELTVMDLVSGRGTLPLIAGLVTPRAPYVEWARAFLWRVMGIRPPLTYVGELARKLETTSKVQR